MLEEHKGKSFKLRCIFSSFKSTKRKNVPKYLVRNFVKEITTNPALYLNFQNTEYLEVMAICQELYKIDSVRDPGATKKDYVKVVNGIINSEKRHTFALVLKKILKKFQRGEYGRISKENKKIYHDTVAALHEYCCGLPK